MRGIPAFVVTPVLSSTPLASQLVHSARSREWRRRYAICADFLFSFFFRASSRLGRGTRVDHENAPPIRVCAFVFVCETCSSVLGRVAGTNADSGTSWGKTRPGHSGGTLRVGQRTSSCAQRWPATRSVDALDATAQPRTAPGAAADRFAKIEGTRDGRIRLPRLHMSSGLGACVLALPACRSAAQRERGRQLVSANAIRSPEAPVSPR